MLAESGNVRTACELSGAGLGCIYRLRRTEPGFTALMEAARAVADRRLGAQPAHPRPLPQAGGEDPGDDGLVIRRGIGGRLRMVAAGERRWSARHDSIFLGHLAATGNVGASARAAGFTRKTAYNQREARPGFARAWDERLEIAALHLENRLLSHVYRRLGAIEEAAFEAAHATPLDIDVAIALAGRWQKRSARRKG